MDLMDGRTLLELFQDFLDMVMAKISLFYQNKVSKVNYPWQACTIIC